MPDGRYMIFYTFDSETSDDTAAPADESTPEKQDV